MRPISRLLALLCLALPLAPAEAGTIVKLGPAPVLGGGEYSTGGGITVAVQMHEWAGRTGLCGVWAESEQLTAYLRDEGRRILAKGSIALGGEVLTYNLDFLRQVAPRDSYGGAPAGCVRLKRAWRPGDAARTLKVRIPRRELRFGNQGHNGGGLRITFRDTGRVNPAMRAGGLLAKSWTSFDLNPLLSQ